MQTQIIYDCKTTKKFPWIGMRGELIVLFTDYDEGVVLEDDLNYIRGEYRDDWVMSSFTEFTGQITLSN